jgi:predicted transposase YdaD
MAPLAAVPVQDVPRVLEQIDARLAAEAPPPEAARMMASTLTLAGMRLDPDVIETLGRRLRTMNILKDSSFYQVILKEGREEGREEGRKEGRKEGIKMGQRQGQLTEAQKLLFRQGRIRFGRLDKATRAAIEAIADLERLERLSVRLLTATSWADLLAETK